MTCAKLLTALLLCVPVLAAAEAPKAKGKATHSPISAGHAVPPPLTPDQLAIAQHIHLGRIPCEMGNFLHMSADAAAPGYFSLQTRTHRYHMVPVVTSTGAIRLEDAKTGAVLLQLANKSMLMNTKLGQRLADECMSPAQLAVAETLKTNPPPSVLDAPSAQ
jgi:hypothetical protein